MKTNSMNQFGTTGIADAGVYGHVVEASPSKMGLLTATPQGVPGPAGDEQLR